MSFSSRLSESSRAEKKISKLVHVLLQVQYDYTAALANLNKEDPTQVGVRKYLKKMIKTVRSDVQTLIKIQQDLDGRVNFTDLNSPLNIEFDSVLKVLYIVLENEKKINKKLVDLHSQLVGNVEQTPATEQIEEMVQERDQVIRQIVEHIVHLEQNQGTVGEFTVSRMMQEEHFRLRQTELQEQQVKYQLLPAMREEQQSRKQLSSSSSNMKRVFLSAKKRQLPQPLRALRPSLDQQPRMKKLLQNQRA